MTDEERMQELLAYANLTAVAKAIGVSKTMTSQWAKGTKKVSPFRLRQVENLLRPDRAEQPVADTDLLAEMRAIRQLLTDRLAPGKQTTAPAWWAEAESRLRTGIEENRNEIRGAIVPQSLVDRMEQLVDDAAAQESPGRQTASAHGQAGRSRGAAAGTRRPRR